MALRLLAELVVGLREEKSELNFGCIKFEPHLGYPDWDL